MISNLTSLIALDVFPRMRVKLPPWVQDLFNDPNAPPEMLNKFTFTVEARCSLDVEDFDQRPPESFHDYFEESYAVDDLIQYSNQNQQSGTSMVSRESVQMPQPFAQTGCSSTSAANYSSGNLNRLNELCDAAAAIENLPIHVSSAGDTSQGPSGQSDIPIGQQALAPNLAGRSNLGISQFANPPGFQYGPGTSSIQQKANVYNPFASTFVSSVMPGPSSQPFNAPQGCYPPAFQYAPQANGMQQKGNIFDPFASNSSSAVMPGSSAQPFNVPRDVSQVVLGNNIQINPQPLFSLVAQQCTGMAGESLPTGSGSHRAGTMPNIVGASSGGNPMPTNTMHAPAFQQKIKQPNITGAGKSKHSQINQQLLSCTICAMCFEKPSSLKSHRKKHHME